MITAIRVTNFRQHEFVHKSLSPGVNILTGKSGLGKSNFLIRPLRWLVFNRPLGTSMRRWGIPDDHLTKVTIWIDNGFAITRGIDGKGKDNFYLVEGKGSEPQFYRGFGANPPDAITQLLNMGEINFQFQHDRMFLLSMGKPELARVLNELGGIDDIDIATSKVTARYNLEKGELDKAKKDVKTLTQDLAKFQDIDGLEVGILILEGLQDEIDNKRQLAGEMRETARKIATTLENSQLLSPGPGMSARIAQISERIAQIESLRQHSAGLRGAGERIIQTQAVVDKYNGLVELKRRVSLISDTVINQADERRGVAGEMKVAATRITLTRTLADETTKRLHRETTEYTKARGDACPTCGKAW